MKDLLVSLHWRSTYDSDWDVRSLAAGALGGLADQGVLKPGGLPGGLVERLAALAGDAQENEWVRQAAGTSLVFHGQAERIPPDLRPKLEEQYRSRLAALTGPVEKPADPRPDDWSVFQKELPASLRKAVEEQLRVLREHLPADFKQAEVEAAFAMYDNPHDDEAHSVAVKQFREWQWQALPFLDAKLRHSDIQTRLKALWVLTFLVGGWRNKPNPSPVEMIEILRNLYWRSTYDQEASVRARAAGAFWGPIPRFRKEELPTALLERLAALAADKQEPENVRESAGRSLQAHDWEDRVPPEILKVIEAGPKF